MNMISQFQIKDMLLIYQMDEVGMVGLLLIPKSCLAEVVWEKKYCTEPLIQVKLAGDDYPFGFAQGRTMRNSASVQNLLYGGQQVCDGRIVTELTDRRGYHYYHHILYRDDSEAIECYTSMENRSAEPITIEMISSFTLGSITPFTDGIAEESMILHQIRSTWSAEGRLVSHPLEELQLEPSWQQYSANSLRFGQVGSMPVREYAPFAAVEDIKNGVTWAVQLTHASSWQLEAYRRDDCLVLSGGLADRELGHWTKILNPGECFETPKAVLTVAKGGADHAAQRLTEDMRGHLSLPYSERSLPIIFNEFCTTWGCPDEEKVRKMAETLKGKGIKYFVIDAGWYDRKAFGEFVDIGGWDYNPKRFPHGMKRAAEIIRECGMVPGIWFEFEISGADSRTFLWTDHLLTRDGIPITSGKRRFFDMRQEWTTQYLSEKVIGFLEENEFGYIKVDYNETIGIGCDGSESQGEGLRQQILGTQRFFEKLHEKLPEVVIEVCSSGGHRLVPAFMERVSMASFSDAHECDEIPIIAANMHRMILPRQSQIWAVLKKENSLKKFYYQIAATFLGRCCISGDIQNLQKEQWDVVSDGFRFYEKAVPVIDRGETFYEGTHIVSYRKPKGYQGIIRKQYDGKCFLFVIHTFYEVKKQIKFKFPLGSRAEIEYLYGRKGICASICEGFLILEGLEAFDGIGILIRKKNSLETNQ